MIKKEAKSSRVKPLNLSWADPQRSGTLVPSSRLGKEVGHAGPTPPPRVCLILQRLVVQIKCDTDGSEAPGPGLAHGCPPRPTHTGHSPPTPGSASGARTWPSPKAALLYHVLDITLWFVRTLSTRAPLAASPAPSSELPRPLLSLCLPWVPEAGRPKVLAWPQDQLGPRVKFPWLQEPRPSLPLAILHAVSSVRRKQT